jgi:CheY-like chemotaxis protein
MVGVMPDSKPLVLIVEDENLVRFGAVAIVEEAGYEAISASDADEAILF